MAPKLLPKPCDTCPYRRDTPPGVWDQEEYEKLPRYDDQDRMGLGTFLCHNGAAGDEQTICRGWASVHRDSVAVRVALMRVNVTYEELKPDRSLYRSGAEACAAGLAGVEKPGRAAKKAVTKILTNRKKGTRRGRQP